MPLTNALTTRYRIFLFDAGYKGYTRAFLETLYEVLQKRKLKKIGVIHPDLSDNLEATKAKSLYKDAHENQPSSFYMLKKAFRRLQLKAQGIHMLDIGCGAGRVLTFGMLLRFKRVTGVDLDEEGIRKAICNCRRMQENGYATDFDISAADACNLKIPDDVNLIYMFNPFGEKTMNTVLDGIISHVKNTGKELHVIYSNPTHKAIFDGKPEVTKIHESFFKNKKPDVAIYRIKSER
ncbi:class I SAM-dependent methyltransferase [Ferruginibacter sp. HRS2-29]|uniref:class I SAM-dependent methyltransferase n=1 Tax=Ferruginibacter sp. HRS2-29 TaxID=2487334 RepID=UPI0020CD911A|nr:class I SAM-dependent methyltransferase [Ferruginibacter sp. HRS2-29]MCP9751048.1 class I SAM-dependent methyltransferase [Ferruginibacter sp. HRS2-29]